MARILLTGMSGAGKSTLLDELAQRGRLTVDTDDDVVVSGTVENQGRFYDRFEHVWCC